MAQPQDLSRGLEPGRVLLRFCVRMIIMASFAAFSSIGFDKSLSVLLWMAMVFCAVGAMIKREQAFTTVLNHWDEMMGYAAVLALLGVFERPLPA
jgi:uncharacterized membrane protein